MNNSQGKKKSTFIASETILAGAYFDFWAGSVNYRISSANFMSQLGVTGSMAQAGAVGNVPVLNVSGTVNQIRGLEIAADSGLSGEISAENGITLQLNAQSTGGGTPLLSDTNKVRRLVKGPGIKLDRSGDDITIGLDGVTPSPVSSLTTGITAYAGGGQANAVELTTTYNEVAVVATDYDSVKLDAAVADTRRIVINDNPLNRILSLYPASGETIVGSSGADAAIDVPPNGLVSLYSYDGATWVRETEFTQKAYWRGYASGFTTQVDAVVLGMEYCSVGGLVDYGSFKVPPALPGMRRVIWNDSSSKPARIYPSSGEFIGNLAINAAFVLGPYEALVIYCPTTASWMIESTSRRQAEMATGITAYAGGGQANATQLTKEINLVQTIGATGDSVKLPQATEAWLGRSVEVHLEVITISDLYIYPYSGDLIFPKTVDQPYWGQGPWVFRCYEAGKWAVVIS